MAGAVAACGAVTFTNPFEVSASSIVTGLPSDQWVCHASIQLTLRSCEQVVKTRMQLQGELQSRTARASPVYPNAFSGFLAILRNEGLRGLQRGLLTAYCYQVVLNGTRLGLYEPVKEQLQAGVDSITGVSKSLPILSMIGSGAATGVLGAFLASPLFLIKTVSQPSFEPKSHG